jgi:small GTP-binding protein
MIQKKICLLGAFAVGKTSLVRRFLTSAFSEDYQTTIGVTIEKKALTGEGQPVTLLIWDLYGEDEFQRIRESYLRGSSGYILVCDGTRGFTWDSAMKLQQLAESVLGPVPFVLVVNKSDLADQWEISDSALDAQRKAGWHVVTSSARTGEGVEAFFSFLTQRMLETDSR